MTTSPPDDNALISEAAAAHGATITAPLLPGGQKLVMLVKTPTSNDAVLKIVRVDATATNEALTRAEREAALLASVSHPHIVKALSTSVSLGNPVYAICWLEEYLDGSDLRDLVGSPWAWPDVYDLGRDIADALADLHVRSVVHRDLSAGNVRRLSSGR